MTKFDNNLPIYLQLSDKIKYKIISGELKSGEKLESVRSYAEIYEVTSNTVQRALNDLESQGLIYSKRTIGKFVTDDTELIEQTKQAEIDADIKKMIIKLMRMGYSKEKILKSLKRILDEEI